jgi:hypothetical protein
VLEQCRNCGSPARLLEVSGWGGGAPFLPVTPEFEATVSEEVLCDDTEPRWLCRIIDARACPTCGVCDLAARDLATYLQCDGPHLPRSPLSCPACASTCLGPIRIECFGVLGTLLAYLDRNYGAELDGRLCEGCGLVWLSLYPDDSEARRELVARFPSAGPCGRCGRGQLRVTRVDVPHAGFAGLYDPAVQTGRPLEAGLVADLVVAVCDSCGEAETRGEWCGTAPP